MGLFDGRIRSDDSGSAVADADPVAYGSTAHVAALIGAPVVLVVDGSGHSQSPGRAAARFLTYDSSVRIAGVILNRVGSPATNRCCGTRAPASACLCSG